MALFGIRKKKKKQAKKKHYTSRKSWVEVKRGRNLKKKLGALEDWIC